jgi:CRP/FNR family cyclic AMP-dependent transcriptional regulator
MAKSERTIKRMSTTSTGAEPGASADVLYMVLAQRPFLCGLEARQLKIICGLAMQITFLPGRLIFQQGDPANRFYLILEGNVELEFESEKAETIFALTLGSGDELGWSWMFAPHTFRMSARAIEPIRAIFVYGTILRQLCEDDHDLGYELMKRIAGVVLRSHIALEEKLANSGGPSLFTRAFLVTPAFKPKPQDQPCALHDN